MKAVCYGVALVLFLTIGCLLSPFVLCLALARDLSLMIACFRDETTAPDFDDADCGILNALNDHP